MAQKRMFSLSVVDTDKFLEMPISARLLYYELGMRADDDGFVSNWKKILLFTGLKEDDLKILIMKNFIIPFESGVIVIRHWRMNNYLQNDRTKPTIYQEELKELNLDNNNVYNLYTDCIHSIDKNSIDKNSIDIYTYDDVKKIGNLVENKKAKCPTDKTNKKFVPPTLEEIENYCKEKGYNIDTQFFYEYFTEGNWVDSKGNKVKNWKQKIITWEKRETKTNKPIKNEWFDKKIEKEELSQEEEEEMKSILNKY